MVKLAGNGYAGANHSHFTELLREREGIDLSRPTVRRILVKAGIGSPRSRGSQQHRFRRRRMPQEGMLVQIDGSQHSWLEDRGPKLTLLIAVDDATRTGPRPPSALPRTYRVLLTLPTNRPGLGVAESQGRQSYGPVCSLLSTAGSVPRPPAVPHHWSRCGSPHSGTLKSADPAPHDGWRRTVSNGKGGAFTRPHSSHWGRYWSKDSFKVP